MGYRKSSRWSFTVRFAGYSDGVELFILEGHRYVPGTWGIVDKRTTYPFCISKSAHTLDSERNILRKASDKALVKHGERMLKLYGKECFNVKR